MDNSALSEADMYRFRSDGEREGRYIQTPSDQSFLTYNSISFNKFLV